MKIIDDKGRLFGKINLIDFLIILFLLCLTPAFYFAYKILYKKPASTKPASTKPAVKKGPEENLELYFILKGLDIDTLRLIAVGDKEMDEQGEVIAEILGLGIIEDSSYAINVGNYNTVMALVSGKKQIYAKMRLRCHIENPGIVYFKGQRIKESQLVEFNMGKYKAKGVITTASQAGF